uniref:RE55091p n=1 Tax=Drosophila melanogaster TaxID=7227 RepID=Q8SYK9_DROME|nr:RE55091p [Drosophila melanogaster]
MVRRAATTVGSACKNYGQNCSKFARNKRTMADLQQIASNNERAEALINSIEAEISGIQQQLVERQKQELIKENAALAKEVEAALAQLVQLELRNGKKQIPVPGARGFCTSAAPVVMPAEAGPATLHPLPRLLSRPRSPRKRSPRRRNRPPRSPPPLRRLPSTSVAWIYAWARLWRWVAIPTPTACIWRRSTAARRLHAPWCPVW